MKLVQKLPIGLGLVCAMLLSSCSKEDAETPAPKEENVNVNSNLKVEAGSAFISSTKTEYMGEGILPGGWSRNNDGFSSNTASYPVGVSHLYRLWGDPSKPFINGMSIIPWASSIHTFITVTTLSILSKTGKSSVKTKITGLLPGKKYALKVYVGSSLPKATIYVPNPTYAKSCLLTVGAQETVVDMSNFYHSWIEKVITFTATSPQMNFTFSASPKQAGQYAYAHLLVPYSSIKQLN